MLLLVLVAPLVTLVLMLLLARVEHTLPDAQGHPASPVPEDNGSPSPGGR